MSKESSTYCKFAHLGINCDMSGMVQPCQLSTYWFKDQNGDFLHLKQDTLKDAWRSESRRQFIEKLDSGVKHDACKVCWDVEASGNQSQRMVFNETLKDVEAMNEQPRIVILKPGNKCNNACRSCNADTSSAWYKDSYKMSGSNAPYKEWIKFFKDHNNTYQKPSIEEQFKAWQKGIIFWDLYGGEPLIIPLTYKLIKDSIAQGTAKDQDLQIHTNGTVYDPNLIKLASHFKSFSLGYSIDAVGLKNDYIRKLSVWDKVLENLKKYRSDIQQHAKLKLVIRTCTTPWNVYYLDELWDYFQYQLPIKIGSPTIVQDQPHTDVSYLPTHVKQEVYKKLTNYSKKDQKYEKWIKQPIKWLLFDPNDHNEKQNSFMLFNNKLDKIRKEKFNKVMPEYASLFTL